MHPRPVLAGSLALLLLASTPAASRAQGWTLDVAAGRAVHDPVSARIGSTVASLGVGWEGAAGARWLYLSAGGPLGDPGPAWGAGGLGGWVGTEVGPLRLGTRLGGHGYGYAASGENPAGGGGTVEVMPMAAVARGPVRAEVGAGFVGVADVLGDSSDTRGFFDSSALLAWAAQGVQVSAHGRWLAGEGGEWPYAGAAVRVDHGRGHAWGFAGEWLADDHPSPATAYGAGASWRIGGRTEVSAEVRQEPVDPVYFNPPRRTWTLQLSRALGPRRGAAAPAAPVPEVAGGRVTFRLPRGEHPAAPVLVGDFTRWQPVAMGAEGRYWAVTLPLGRGVYHYGFRTAAGAWLVPAHLPSVDDGMGSTSAVLVVP